MGDTKALLVGVCEYTFNPSVCPLPFCSNDVAAVYQALIDGLNVSAGNILVSGNNGRITKDCLLSDLQSILNATTDKDTVISNSVTLCQKEKTRICVPFLFGGVRPVAQTVSPTGGN